MQKCVAMNNGRENTVSIYTRYKHWIKVAGLQVAMCICFLKITGDVCQWIILRNPETGAVVLGFVAGEQGELMQKYKHISGML